MDLLSRLLLCARGQPVVLQGELGECGLACLASVLAAHGRGRTLDQLRDQHGSLGRGARLDRILAIADREGLDARALRIDADELPAIACPAILHWRLDHFVVLERVDRRGAWIMDPAHGREHVDAATIQRDLTGVVVELRPRPDLGRERARPRLRLRALIGAVAGLGDAGLWLFAQTLCLQATMLVAPLLVQNGIDRVVTGRDQALLLPLVIAGLALVALQAALAWTQGWTRIRLETGLRLGLAAPVIRRLLELPLAFFEHRHLGDIMARISSVRTLQETTTGPALQAVLDLLFVTVASVLLASYGTGLAGAVLLAAALYLLLRWRLHTPLRTATRSEIERQAQLHTRVMEDVRSIAAIRLQDGAARQHRRWWEDAVDHARAQVRVRSLGLSLRLWRELTAGGARWCVVALVLASALDGRFTAGMVFAALAYEQLLSNRLFGLVDATARISLAGVHLDRVAGIAAAAPVRTPERPCPLPPGPLSVVLRDISVQPDPAAPPVIEGLDLEVRPGECVALAGPSGCGKSSLLRVILGLSMPVAGRVRVGGVDLVDTEPAGRAPALAAVLQDDRLRAGTLLENLVPEPAEHDPRRLWAALRLASVEALVRTAPLGLHTRIGDLGQGLSGGERQRLLIARALYRRPGVLVLDEATSHLDPKTEAAVVQALAGLSMTRILVAHRPETLRRADRVVRLGSS